MARFARFIRPLFLLVLSATAAGAAPTQPPLTASVTTSLPTASGHIRQFAFDGDNDTYFSTERHAGPGDHFTLTFDKPAAVKSVNVVTGRPTGGERLDAGVLEGSADGSKFEPLAAFRDGTADATPGGKKLRAIRVRPTREQDHPLAVREITLDSTPAVAVFRYPVEFVVNVDDAPDLKEWAEKVARVCERQYPRICEELKSDGFRPRHLVTLTLRKDYRGVAATSGGHIVGSVRYFRAHPDDVGAMVHETVHVIQSYRGRYPGWLVEGVADYVRFFRYEPGNLGQLNVGRAHYNGSYRVTAAFLHYAEKYDKELVRKLNRAMREGTYRDELFKDLTGKTLQELDEEWRTTLKR